MEKYCLECGAPLGTFGRADRKFCSPACKNLWHNNKASGYRVFRQRIISLLDRNHMILNGLIKRGIRSIDKHDIMTLGFSPYHATSVTRNRLHLRYFCFDISYCISDSRVWGIEKHSKIYEKDGPPRGEPSGK